MTLQVTSLPAHWNVPGKAGPRSQVGKHRVASGHGLRPRAAPLAAWPGSTSHRYFTWRQETGQVQPLSITFSSASSSQGDVFRGASGSQGALGSSSGRSHMEPGSLGAQEVSLHGRVPSPMGEVPLGTV